VPDSLLSSQTLALIHAKKPVESAFSHLSASQELTDEAELS
jgi:hypothetical protein